MADLEEARDKLKFGKARKNRVVDEKEKEILACHEGGHALVQALETDYDPLAQSVGDFAARDGRGGVFAAGEGPVVFTARSIAWRTCAFVSAAESRRSFTAATLARGPRWTSRWRRASPGPWCANGGCPRRWGRSSSPR